MVGDLVTHMLHAAFREWWLKACTEDSPGILFHSKGLIANWNAPHNRRHYHTLAHLATCIDDFRAVAGLADDPQAVELALWCHDAVYDPHPDCYRNNESSSAAVALRIAHRVGWINSRAAKVAAMVMATTHGPCRPDSDTGLVLDIDLVILGAPAAAFDAYEVAIRKEYDWVDGDTFCAKRAAILRDFLAQPTIYRHRWFQTRYEDQARANLRRSIAHLEA